MAKVSLMGNAMNTIGNLPAKESIAPDFEATKGDLSSLKLSDLRGKKSRHSNLRCFGTPLQR